MHVFLDELFSFLHLHNDFLLIVEVILGNSDVAVSGDVPLLLLTDRIGVVYDQEELVEGRNQVEVHVLSLLDGKLKGQLLLSVIKEVGERHVVAEGNVLVAFLDTGESELTVVQSLHPDEQLCFFLLGLVYDRVERVDHLFVALLGHHIALRLTRSPSNHIGTIYHHLECLLGLQHRL